MRHLVVLGFSIALLAPVAQAQHAPFQSFFSTVCTGSTSGSLSTRCAETPGGGGNLSTDSEVSLNPNQSLATHDASQARARQLSQDIEDRLAARRGEDDAAAAPIGIILNGRYARAERDRSFQASATQPQPLQEERGYESNEGSVQLGADMRMGERAIVGLLFSWSRTDAEFDRDVSTAPSFAPPSKSGEAEVDSYVFTAFGSYDIGSGFWVAGSFGGGVTRHTFTRSVLLQESTRAIPTTLAVLEADVDGWELAATAGAGYDRQDGAFSYGPYLRVRYVTTTNDAYVESDLTSSGLAMSVAKETRHSAVGVLGARASYALSTGFGVVVPSLRIEWEHEYAQTTLDTVQSFNSDNNANTYRLRGARPDRDWANIGAGVTTVLPGGLMLFAEYEALLGFEDVSRHRAAAGVRVELP